MKYLVDLDREIEQQKRRMDFGKTKLDKVIYAFLKDMKNTSKPVEEDLVSKIYPVQLKKDAYEWEEENKMLELQVKNAKLKQELCRYSTEEE